MRNTPCTSGSDFNVSESLSEELLVTAKIVIKDSLPGIRRSYLEGQGT